MKDRTMDDDCRAKRMNGVAPHKLVGIVTFQKPNPHLMT